MSMCVCMVSLHLCVSLCIALFLWLCLYLSVSMISHYYFYFYFYFYFIADGVINNYDTATALLITFVVNNHMDDSENENAELWEKEFLRTLKDYKSDNLIISYTAEVFVYLSVLSIYLTELLMASIHCRAMICCVCS